VERNGFCLGKGWNLHSFQRAVFVAVEEGGNAAIKGVLVGPPRFELGTSCTPSKRASQAAPRPEASILRQTASRRATLFAPARFSASTLLAHGAEDNKLSAVVCFNPRCRYYHERSALDGDPVLKVTDTTWEGMGPRGYPPPSSITANPGAQAKDRCMNPPILSKQGIQGDSLKQSQNPARTQNAVLLLTR
jgi:hypothetical protein